MPRSIHAFQSTCCGSDLSWVCVRCSQVSCSVHDPSPGEARGICELCAPITLEETE